MDTQVSAQSSVEFPSISSGQIVLTSATDQGTTGVFLTSEGEFPRNQPGQFSISLGAKSLDELRTQMFEPSSTKLTEDLPECILLRKGSPKLNENYYELNCNVCDSLFAVIETKVCRSGHSPMFYCPICKDLRRHTSDVYRIIPRTYMNRPYYDSCILI